MKKGHRADWLYEAKWGVMCHFLGTPELTSHEWNRRVDGFDTEALATQLEYTGARYFLFTVGQNSGHYCSPNATYDSITGIDPSCNPSRPRDTGFSMNETE